MGSFAHPPNVVMAPPLIDPCPPFAPSTYQNWKRELRLWIAGFPTATQSQFLSEFISVLPQAAKITGMSYMEATADAQHLR